MESFLGILPQFPPETLPKNSLLVMAGSGRFSPVSARHKSGKSSKKENLSKATSLREVVFFCINFSISDGRISEPDSLPILLLFPRGTVPTAAAVPAAASAASSAFSLSHHTPGTEENNHGQNKQYQYSSHLPQNPSVSMKLHPE